MLVNLWEGGEARAEAQRFCDIWSVDGVVLLDETAAFARAIGIPGVPTNVLVGADGIVQEVGATVPEALGAAADRLLRS